MASDTFARIGLDADAIQKFYNKFCEIDKDESNEIDLDEFYRYFRLARTPFADRGFSIMDEDGMSLRCDYPKYTKCSFRSVHTQLNTLCELSSRLWRDRFS